MLRWLTCWLQAQNLPLDLLVLVAAFLFNAEPEILAAFCCAAKACRDAVLQAEPVQLQMYADQSGVQTLQALVNRHKSSSLKEVEILPSSEHDDSYSDLRQILEILAEQIPQLEVLTFDPETVEGQLSWHSSVELDKLVGLKAFSSSLVLELDDLPESLERLTAHSINPDYAINYGAVPKLRHVELQECYVGQLPELFALPSITHLEIGEVLVDCEMPALTVPAMDYLSIALYGPTDYCPALDNTFDWEASIPVLDVTAVKRYCIPRANRL